MSPQSHDWRCEGKCARLSLDKAERLFFGVHRREPDPEALEAARHLCGACPVREACLADALAVPALYDRYGVRGGLLPAERQALRAAAHSPPDPALWTGSTLRRPTRRRAGTRV